MAARVRGVVLRPSSRGDRWHRWVNSEAIAAYAFLLPNLLGFVVFTALPVVASLCLSFYDWDIIRWPPRFVGLGNFIQLVGWHREGMRWLPNDPLFWKFIYNTMFLMLGIPLNMLGSLMLAWLLNQRLKGLVWFRTTFFLPTISSGVAIALLWTWLYNPEFGPVNQALEEAGRFLQVPLRGPHWLTDPAWAKPALMLMGFWTMMGGYNMVLYLAALQGIPKELYESAEIDGAGAWRKFWHITWPMISPTTFFILTMSIIGGFQGGFLNAYVMTRGGPHGATTTIEYYIFNQLYAYQHAGYAAAIAWLLFLGVLLVTLFHWRAGGRWVFYGA